MTSATRATVPSGQDLRETIIGGRVLDRARRKLDCPSLLHVIALCLAFSGAGCSSYADRVDDDAAALGFERHERLGAKYRHVIYRNRKRGGAGPLHVYIEGDGRAWLDDTTVARDPTPYRAITLKLMAEDASPAVFVGRPCYHGTSTDEVCDFRAWTTARYGEEVVASMSAVVAGLQGTERGIVFIGHSGGGALAALLAARTPRAVGLVTIGANLDTLAWSELHGYTPLYDSLNPAIDADLPDTVLQLHLVGSDDASVPPFIVDAYARQHSSAAVCVIPGYDHRCCWSDLWPTVVEWLPDGLVDFRGAEDQARLCERFRAAATGEPPP